LHDARLNSFNVNLTSNTLILEVDADRAQHPHARRFDPYPVRITITGLCYFKLDPPDVLNGYTVSGPSWINAGDDVVAAGLADADVVSKLPKGAFVHWIYLNDWIAFMVIGAMDAQIQRLD
jgi:hypothetical protein